MTSATFAGKNATLAALERAVRGCRICRDTPLGAPLPHEPNPVLVVSATARILIASQAPGTRAHAGGRPFIDRSGLRLRDWMGVTEDEFYDDARIGIVPMGFCFPGHDRHGGDLPPRRECRLAWHDRLFALLPAADLILAVGSHAQAYHLPRLGLEHLLRPTLTDTVRGWAAMASPATGPAIVPLPHPSWRNTAWLKQNPWFETDLLPVLRAKIRKRL